MLAPRRLAVAAASLLLIVAVATGGGYWFKIRPARLEREETTALAAALAPLLRAEEPRLGAAAALDGQEAQSPAAADLLSAARAFLGGRTEEAAPVFARLAAAFPGDPHLPAFQAAAQLRLGNQALALELYLRAIALKTAAEPLALANDEMGAALALFLLGRAAEARPFVEKAWRARLAALGPDDTDTLAAANRLAAAYVNLGLLNEAEARLLETYRSALAQGERAAEALSESRLLLTLIYKEAGREAELKELFGLELAVVEAVKEAPPRPPLPPAQPEEAAAPVAPKITTPAWAETARALAGRDDALAADLWERIVADKAPAGAYLELARAARGAGRPERAWAALFGASGPAADWPEAAERALLAADILADQGRLKEAEAALLAVAEKIDARLGEGAGKNGRAPDPALADAHLRLALKLADILARQARPPQEAEIELRAALGRLGRQPETRYPAAAEVHLALGRLTRAQGRPRDSREFYRRARAGAEAQLKANPEAGAALAETARLAAEEMEKRPAKKPGGRPPEAPAAPPLASPDLLRLQLAALAFLDRLEEFPALLEPSRAEARRRFGPGAREERFYFSLWLKWLEESGRVEELTRELLAQAAEPLGACEEEKALNRGGALFYAARVNEKAGRPAEAADLYARAREAWLARPAAAGRLAEVEEALGRLRP